MVNLAFWKRKNATEKEAILQKEPPDSVEAVASSSVILRTPLESAEFSTANPSRVSPETEHTTDDTVAPEDTVIPEDTVVPEDTVGPEERIIVQEEKEEEEKEKCVTDVNKCIEEIGFGKYQWKIVFVMGLMSFADSCEIWLSTIVISK